MSYSRIGPHFSQTIRVLLKLWKDILAVGLPCDAKVYEPRAQYG